MSPVLASYDPQIWGNAAQWLSGVTTLVAAWLTLKSAAGSSKAAQRAEHAAQSLRELVDKITPGLTQISVATMVAHYNGRYERLVFESDPGIDSNRFFAQFWNLQYEQFLTYRAGLIPDADFRFWQRERMRDFQNASIYRGDKTFKQGWFEARETLAIDQGFRELVDCLATSEGTDADRLTLAMELAQRARARDPLARSNKD